MADFFAKGNKAISGFGGDITWKDGGTILTTEVALPSDFKELLISVNVNNTNIILTATVLKDMLSTTALNVRSGYYTGSTAFGYFSVLVTDSTITLNAIGLNGNIVTTSSTAKYYYR